MKNYLDDCFSVLLELICVHEIFKESSKYDGSILWVNKLICFVVLLEKEKKMYSAKMLPRLYLRIMENSSFPEFPRVVLLF